jgi:uncharacterized protein (TIGR03067 family)
MRPLLYFLAFAVFSLGCCRAFGGADDAKKLQGKWEVVELVAYGKKVDLATIKGVKFLFAADKLTIQPPNDKLEEIVARTYTLKIEPKKQPAQVDLISLDGPNKGNVSPGIYELKGDTLRWCQSDDPKSKERPKGFTSPEKSAFYLFTLKRTK